MTFGIRIRDTSGRVLADHDSNFGRIVGSFETGSAPGSMTVEALSHGSAFWVVLPLSVATWGRLPVVTRSGNTLSWAFPASQGADQPLINSLVVYGYR